MTMATMDLAMVRVFLVLKRGRSVLWDYRREARRNTAATLYMLGLDSIACYVEWDFEYSRLFNFEYENMLCYKNHRISIVAHIIMDKIYKLVPSLAKYSLHYMYQKITFTNYQPIGNIYLQKLMCYDNQHFPFGYYISNRS